MTRQIFGSLALVAAAALFMAFPATAAATLDTGQATTTPAVDFFDVVPVPADGDMLSFRVLAFEVAGNPCDVMATSRDLSSEGIPWVIDTFLLKTSDMCSGPLDRNLLPAMPELIPK